MFKTLNQHEKETFQRRGYMCEHLLCLYSMVAETTALYDNEFPIFFNGFRQADVIFFGYSSSKQREDMSKCLKELMKLPLDEINVVTPILCTGYDFTTKLIDFDFHIDVDAFDITLRGKEYKSIRYRLKQAEKQGYYTRISRDFTKKHIYVLSRHMTHYTLNEWDYEELLSLERFFRDHKHGVMIEVYKNDVLLGYDILDFFEDNRIMAVPLGIYLDPKMLGISDFMMYKNLMYAKNKGYRWVDVGLSCESIGLRRFKEKWHAKPKYQVYVQKLDLVRGYDAL